MIARNLLSGDDSLAGEPECVALYRSVANPSKVGAHAMQDLPRGVRFGPWNEEEEEGKPMSKWMECIQTTDSMEDANLICYYHKVRFYCKTIKEVKDNEEFLLYEEILPIEPDFTNDVPNQSNCDRTTSQQKQLETSKHGVNSTCKPNDGQRFSSSKAAKSERRFQCEVCGSAFKQQGHLVTHSRIHTGEKPHVCDVCGAAFSEKGTLVNHSRIHTGEKPYVCEACGAAFTVKGSLINHSRTHTGEKPYVCEVCDAAFTVRNNLVKHSRIHTGEKPYVCEVCGAAFKQKSDSVRHSRIHTGEKPYLCEVCGATFTRKGDLTNHSHIHTR